MHTGNRGSPGLIPITQGVGTSPAARFSVGTMLGSGRGQNLQGHRYTHTKEVSNG